MASLHTPHPVDTAPSRAPRRPIPPLQSGDRLSREEYLRRYEAMPKHVKAERIEGIVYMAPAAVSADFHGEHHANMVTFLSVYYAFTPGTKSADDSTTLLDLDNEPQPDACLYILPSHGGRIRKNEKGYIVGSPELVAEIAASTVSLNSGVKHDVYRRNGVREYLVHRVYDGQIDWFILRDGNYDRLTPDADGIIRSETFPGLWLKTDSMIAGDLLGVLNTLNRGIASPEHQAFAAGLAGQGPTGIT